jgi:hypothetical protein
MYEVHVLVMLVHVEVWYTWLMVHGSGTWLMVHGYLGTLHCT